MATLVVKNSPDLPTLEPDDLGRRYTVVYSYIHLTSSYLSIQTSLSLCLFVSLSLCLSVSLILCLSVSLVFLSINYIFRFV